MDRYEIHQWEKEQFRFQGNKKQQSQHAHHPTRWNNVSKMSRRKLNAVKAFKTVKVAKERRHASKTREKRERKGPRLDIYHSMSGPVDQWEYEVVAEPMPLKDTPQVAPATLPENLVVTLGVSAPATMVDFNKIFSEYQLFGGVPKLQLQLLDQVGDALLPPPPGLQVVVEERNHAMHVQSCMCLATQVPSVHQKELVVPLLPLLTFTASPNAKTITFLQQELDILTLLTFSGTVLDDIPLMYREQYGTDLSLPDYLTPEAMLLLSQRVFIYEWKGDVKCALKNQHEYPNQRKESMIFFLKQEFRLLSLLGEADAGISLTELINRYETKYHKNIILPFGTGATLADVLLRSGRAACTAGEFQNDGGYHDTYELIPYLFL